MADLAALERARRQRSAIHSRLIDEGEDELAGLIDKCGKPLHLICETCGLRREVETKCKQKWCPVCVRAIATRRSLKFAAGAAAMKWPLFLTLTVTNIPDPGIPFVRKLRRDFGRLRHRKLWKQNVIGGVAAIEVTNKGKGWHPHLHALIDCRWLALKTPRPQAGENRDHVRSKCRKAKREFTDLWKRVTKEKHGVCWIQRTTGEECAREVLKYSVKGSDLTECSDPIGPLIHQLRATRLVTSFGSLFGKLRVSLQHEHQPLVCDKCGSIASYLPEFIVEHHIRKQRRRH